MMEFDRMLDQLYQNPIVEPTVMWVLNKEAAEALGLKWEPNT